VRKGGHAKHDMHIELVMGSHIYAVRTGGVLELRIFRLPGQPVKPSRLIAGGQLERQLTWRPSLPLPKFAVRTGRLHSGHNLDMT
jgi:hypothetical protein